MLKDLQRVVGGDRAVRGVAAKTEAAKTGQGIMNDGLARLTRALEGDQRHPAEDQFLHLVGEALVRAVPPSGAQAGRRFRTVDLEATDGNGPAPTFYFTDSNSNGRDPGHSWFLSFGNFQESTPYAELLFPLSIAVASEDTGNRRVQPVKMRLISTRGDGSAPPALVIVNPYLPGALAAVKAALKDAFDLELD